MYFIGKIWDVEHQTWGLQVTNMRIELPNMGDMWIDPNVAYHACGTVPPFRRGPGFWGMDGKMLVDPELGQLGKKLFRYTHRSITLGFRDCLSRKPFF